VVQYQSHFSHELPKTAIKKSEEKMQDFAGKTVWITGASSGIGEALSRQLASRGACLVLSARSEDKLQSLKTELDGSDKHHIVPLDLANYNGLQAVVDAALPDIGQVDYLINNGGVSQRALAKDTALIVDEQLIQVNYLGTVAMTKALLPGMLARKQGMIVSISSVAGKIGPQLRSAYAGAKHAVVGFMESLRAELHDENIDVLVICPGFVQTNVSINALDADGEPSNTMDDGIANGIPVDECAERIIDAMLKRQDEVIIARGVSRLGPILKRFAPALFRKMNRKPIR
jgi:short-subunit dehydrogenase